jgi:glucosamine kinase
LLAEKYQKETTWQEVISYPSFAGKTGDEIKENQCPGVVSFWLLRSVVPFWYKKSMSTITHILAVDGGGTKTRAALATADGTPLAEHTGGPCNLFQDPDAGLAEIRALWNHLAAAAGLDPATAAARTALAAGLAGANAPNSLARFRQAFPDFAATHLCTDGYTTLLGATGGQPGGLLAIGTGVVGYRLHRDGRGQKLSGWCFPIGDRGSGAWLGWRAIGDWLEFKDGYADQPSSILWPTLEATLGTTTSDILGWLKPARPGDFAAFAPAVIDAATAGDAKGRALLAEAAAHHIRLAQAMTPTPAEPLVIAGGLAAVFRPHLAAALGDALADAGRTASPLEGAILVAQGRSPAEFTA